MKRKLVKMGRSYYLAIPKWLIDNDMKQGVDVSVLGISEREVVICVRKLGKHNKNSQENRANT
jgi:hypothetical protein